MRTRRADPIPTTTGPRTVNARIGLPLAATALITAASLTFGACGTEGASQDGAADEAPVVVLAPGDVATAGTDTVRPATVLTGTLHPYREVELRAQVPGVVVDLAVDRGDRVRKGQVLARVEAEGIRGQAESARAAVAAAEAGLALARKQLESARRLHDAGALSDLELQQAEAAHEAADAQLAAARAQAAGASESARRSLVTAPISGEVSRRSVSEGEAVQPSQPLLTVVNSVELELAGQVPVAEGTRLRPGMPVEFSVEGYPDRTFRGSVARVEPTADPGTRQLGVYVRLPNGDRSLVGGLFASGRILRGEEQEVVVVPVGAIREGSGGTHVLVVEDGRVCVTPVTVGARDASRGIVTVLEGLRGGEVVVVTPGEVDEGARVRIGGDPGESPGGGTGGEGR